MASHAATATFAVSISPPVQPVAGIEARLVEAGVISETQLELARREHMSRGGVLRRILVDLGFLSAEELAAFIAREAHTEVVDLGTLAIDKAALDTIPRDIARKHKALPVAIKGNALVVAMSDPLDVVAIDQLRRVAGMDIDVVAATERDILNFIDQLGVPADTIQESIDRIVIEKKAEAKEIEDSVESSTLSAAVSADEAPIISLVNQIISRAVVNGASDIHFEPEEKHMRIRTRIDGVLRPDVLIPKALQSAVTARMKILADMDVAESRVPQDGRSVVTVKRRQVNLRVSSLPVSYGESVVVRILDGGASVKTLASMGFAQDMEAQLRKAIDAPYGVFIVTGPTGSGKSTTLYAILDEISTPDLSVFTLEDPVEFRRPGLRQTQIKEDVGLTFSAGLRALLRQDPDVILVGETRDTETATLMVRAALTGHLVFTTLHTNDAPGAIPRLVDMGVEPYLLPSALVGVLAQRLVRRLCKVCREPIHNALAEFDQAKVTVPDGHPVRLWRGAGCSACNNSGYKGRQGVFELMLIDETYHQAIVGRASTSEFHRLAKWHGMRTMFEDGVIRATEGVTTLDELLRVTRNETHGQAPPS